MFTSTLKKLVESIDGATGAILADWEGESVAFYTTDDDFQLKIIAAHKGIIISTLRSIHDQLSLGDMKENIVTSDKMYIITVAITRDYSLVVTMERKSPLALALRRARLCAKELRKEIE